jgi:hypothetical protein
MSYTATLTSVGVQAYNIIWGKVQGRPVRLPVVLYATRALVVKSPTSLRSEAPPPYQSFRLALRTRSQTMTWLPPDFSARTIREPGQTSKAFRCWDGPAHDSACHATLGRSSLQSRHCSALPIPRLPHSAMTCRRSESARRNLLHRTASIVSLRVSRP